MTSTWELTPEWVEHFRARVLQDALSQALSDYWERRARDFASVGTKECDLIALNCRRHAQLLREVEPQPLSAEVVAALKAA